MTRNVPLARIIILLLAVILAGCSDSTNPQDAAAPEGIANREALTVFAAASLTEAFSEIGDRFEEQHPDARLVFNFAGSQQLAQQLAQGAPADVFASANQFQMQAVIDAQRVDDGTQAAFVGNKLVIIYPPDNPGYLRRPLDLSTPVVDLVLADQQVPAGRYALEFLDKASQDDALGADYKSKVLDNVVSYEENVRAVLSKVQLGEANAGIVYLSDAASLTPLEIGTIEIPYPLNVSATYYIATINDTEKSILAEEFITFVASPEGQQILADYGFLLLY